MKQFEYKKIDVDGNVLEPKDLVVRLNLLGLDGWEVMFKDSLYVYLKREVKEEKQLLHD